jgi:hypothetical protein
VFQSFLEREAHSTAGAVIERAFAMQYAITAGFLLAIVAGSFAAVILGGYVIARLIAFALLG